MGKLFKKRVRRRLFNGSKKGITDALVDFWAYLTYGLFIVIFFIISSLQQDAIENKVTVNYETLKTDYNLNIFLRSPVNVDINKDGKIDTITFGEYIAYCNSDSTFCDGLKEKSSDFFDKMLYDTWSMKIKSDSVDMKFGHSYGWDVFKKNFLSFIGGMVSQMHYSILPYEDRLISVQEVPSWDGKSISIEFSNWVIISFV